jgi:hypothetical protein
MKTYDVGGGIKRRWKIGKKDGTLWTGFIWLIMGITGRLI